MHQTPRIERMAKPVREFDERKHTAIKRELSKRVHNQRLAADRKRKREHYGVNNE